jgi:hypothetical protein
MSAAQSALDIIKSSLRLIGAIAPGEPAPADEAQDALMVLNQMIDAWNSERLMIFTVTIAEYPLTVGQQTYTLGPGGNFNAARPPYISSVSIVVLSNPNQPLELEIDYLTDKEWQNIPVKNIPTTVPLKVYDDGAYPLRNLSFWGIPTVAINTRIYSWTALSEFPNLTTKVTFPPGYYEALRYNLALRLAPEWGESVDPQVSAMAAESKGRIKSLNITPIDLRCDNALTSNNGGAYDWRSDSFIGTNR